MSPVELLARAAGLKSSAFDFYGEKMSKRRRRNGAAETGREYLRKLLPHGYRAGDDDFPGYEPYYWWGGGY